MKTAFTTAVLGSILLTGAMATAQVGGGAAKVRAYAPQMSCAQLKQMVATEGAVIIYSSRYIYDRVVANQRYCASGEVTEWKTVNAGDDSRCFAGYVCKQDDSRGDNNNRNGDRGSRGSRGGHHGGHGGHGGHHGGHHGGGRR